MACTRSKGVVISTVQCHTADVNFFVWRGEMQLLQYNLCDGRAWDDIRGAELDAKEVRTARNEEMRFFKELGV